MNGGSVMLVYATFVQLIQEIRPTWSNGMFIGPAFTSYNYHGDIYLGNNCPLSICSGYNYRPFSDTL